MSSVLAYLQENQDLISAKKEPEEIKVVDPGFVDDEGNIAIRHLYIFYFYLYIDMEKSYG